MSTPPEGPSRPKRERSVRYPGAALAEALEFCRTIDDRGLDGLGTAEIAEALGHRNIRTNTFSARLSAARQFGLLTPEGEGFALTPLARSILHPVEARDVPRLLRQALVCPPLYAALASRLGDKKVPEPAVLANLLYHHEHITASAKLPAAEAFLESARFAEALGDDGVFRPRGPVEHPPPGTAKTPPASKKEGSRVRIDLRLWGADEGKVLRVRAPESITEESLERLLQALRLMVRIEKR